jgi:hypothetical protein
MTNISIERWEEIEHDRNQVMNDPNYQEWVKQLNISRAYVNPTGVLKARDLNNQYDFSKSKKSNFLSNIFQL